MGYIYRNGRIYDPKTNPIYYKGKNITKVYRNGVTYYFEWDGTINVRDEYVLTKHDNKIFNYTDSPSLTWYDIEKENIAESFSLTKHGNKTFGIISDHVDIEDVSEEESENEQYDDLEGES